jgi:hypothetical protein
VRTAGARAILDTELTIETAARDTTPWLPAGRCSEVRGMRRLHMSTGAWLFCGIIAAALIMPAGVYAAVSSHVAIGNVGNSTTATVTSQNQLLTTIVPPNAIVRITGTSSGTCPVIYTPPTGKALVLLNATVSMDLNGQSFGYAYIASKSNCSDRLDWFETSDQSFSQQHTYPGGLPLSKLRLYAVWSGAIYATGYLIPASQLPTN